MKSSPYRWFALQRGNQTTNGKRSNKKCSREYANVHPKSGGGIAAREYATIEVKLVLGYLVFFAFHNTIHVVSLC